MTAWLVERAADQLSNCRVGGNGRALCERRKGKKVTQDTAELGGKAPFELNLKARQRKRSNLLEAAPHVVQVSSKLKVGRNRLKLGRSHHPNLA